MVYIKAHSTYGYVAKVSMSLKKHVTKLQEDEASTNNNKLNS